VLGKHPFFNRGHKLSGLDAEALGVDRINTVGGRA
jgi:preprotein translocase subunit SecD